MNKDFENAEQRAFEEWYRKRNPHGDCESVYEQWLGSSEYEDFYLDWDYSE